MSKADGQLIGIKFTEAITSDISALDIASLTVTGQEYDMEPGGILVSGDYEVDTVEAYPSSARYAEAWGGIKTNTEISGNVLRLLQSASNSNGFTGDLTTHTSGTGELGWRFTVGSAAISVVGIRVKGYTSGTITAHIWKVSDSSLVASVSITAVAGSWVTGTLATPVTLSANTDYIVSAPGTDSYNAAPSALTFNSAITYVNGRYGAANTFPASNWSNTVNKADIVIAGAGTYAANGTYESGAVSVGTANLSLGGSVTAPTNTSVKIEIATGATQGAWVEYAIGDTISADTNIWIKLTLSTTDVSVTPTISKLYLSDAIAPDDQILITLKPLKRFHRVKGNLTVSYDSTIGNLAGASGPVASFSQAFTPVDLVNKPNPNDPENITMTATASATLSKIERIDAYSGGDNITLTAYAAATLTHIDDI